MVASVGRRTRAAIVEQNDRALRAAVVDMAFETGWDSVTFTGVAKRAGLTVGAVYGRAESTAELGIDLWESVVRDWLAGVMAELLSAGEAGDRRAMGSALERWHREERMTAVAVDLVIASLFDPDLDEVIGADMRRHLTAPCTPGGQPRVSAQLAAARALVLSFGFGRAIALRGGAALSSLTTAQLRSVAGLCVAPQLRRVSPQGPALDWVRPMGDADSTTRAILRATVEVVGRVGYRRATIARIARAAGVPRGSVMAHFATKADLVGEAARRALIPPGEVWEQYSDVVSKRGPLEARAIFLTDFFKPVNRSLWAVNLELARVGRFIPEVGEFRANPNVLEHTHLGVMLVASFVPGLDKLNYLGPFQAGSAT